MLQHSFVWTAILCEQLYFKIELLVTLSVFIDAAKLLYKVTITIFILILFIFKDIVYAFFSSGPHVFIDFVYQITFISEHLLSYPISVNHSKLLNSIQF